MAAATVPEKPDARPLPPGPGAVRFEGVSFGYDPARPVLHDLTFDVRGGSIVAVVGPTGAGKSTMVNLVARAVRVIADGPRLAWNPGGKP